MSADQLQEWHESRQHAAIELRKLVTDVQSGDVQLTGEIRAEMERLNGVLDERKNDIDSVLNARVAIRETEEARAAWESVVGAQNLERRDNAQTDQVMAFLRGESRSLELDLRQVSREAQLIRSGAEGRELRDLVKVTAAAGGTLVPTTLVRTLYNYMQDFAMIRQTNVRILTTNSGENLDVPVVATWGTAAIVGEGSAIAENDETFTKVTLGAWKYGQLVQVSTEMIDDAGVDILSFVGENAGQALGVVTGNDYINGSGSKATGVLVAAGTGVTGQSSATGVPSYGNLIDLKYSVTAPYRRAGAYWMFNDSSIGKIRGIVSTTGQPIWSQNTVLGAPDTLDGDMILQDPAIAAFATGVVSGVYGNFSRGFIIRDVGAVRFERSNEYAFANDLVTFRAVLRTDSKLLDNRAVKVYRGGTV